MKKIAVIGLGQMGAGFGKKGGYYTETLLKVGIRPKDIVGVDIDPTKLAAAKEKFPSMTLVHSQADRPLRDFVNLSAVDAVFLCTNTPSHHRLLVELMENGIRKIFCEKPLALDMSGVNEIRKTKMRTASEIFTAFLMNFSPAVMHIIERMRQEGLILIQGEAAWGKNRMYDIRPTPGNVEDESPHPIGVFHTLLSASQQEIDAIYVSARLSFLDYIDQRVQQEAHATDVSFPLAVNSSSFITEEVRSSKIPFPMIFQTNSSFVRGKQVRRVECTLAHRDNPTQPVYAVEFNFDTPQGDILEVTRLMEKKTEEPLAFRVDKIHAEVEAFLEFVKCGKRDPRLTGYLEARMLVKLTAAIVESNALNGGIVQAIGEEEVELRRAMTGN